MKNFFSETSILRLIVVLPIIFIILASVILTNIFVSNEENNYQKEIQAIKDEHINNIKDVIKDRIERTVHIIETKNKFNELNNKEEMRNIVLMGHNIIQSTHKEYEHLGTKHVIKEIKQNLRDIRFYYNKSGYFFIYDLEGNNILLPPKPKLEGKNLRHITDPRGKPIVSNAIKLVKENPESFDTWYWWKKDGKELIQKLGFFKRYDPLNIFIGTGKYYDDINKENQHNTYKLLNSIKYKDNSYIFALDDTGKTVVHLNKKILNTPFNSLPDIEKKIVTNILTKAKQEHGAFIEYTPTTQKNETFPSKKISFVKYIPELQLTIGTGLYTNDLQKKLKSKELFLKNNLNETINKIVISSIIVTLILIVIMLFIATALKNILNNYAYKLKEKNRVLEELNSSLEEKVSIAVNKNREQNEILYQQSKMAAMGEMLGNIAHQWRQPLSAISTAASGIKLQDSVNQLDKKLMYQGLDAIVQNTQTLSETIDDFRNFFKTDKFTKEFQIQTCYAKVITLISANLKNKNIQIIENIEDITLNSYENELVQALLNLINNARDALLEIESNKKYIFIDIYEQKDEVLITIKDNAGGIKEDIIDKIFEPYFTTKHQSQGTGIGLYMTQKIIQSSLKGSITISNSTFIYKDKNYIGALCEIRLPKSL